MSRDPEQLLSAYVDGVGELAPDERKQVEALLEADPTVRADEASTRELIGSLRELPREGSEPNWSELEASIANAVGDTVPRPWWRSWRWLIPTASLAATAAVAIIWLHRAPLEPVEPTAHVTPAHPTEPAPMVLWLDDQPVDLGAADTDQLLRELDNQIQAAEIGMTDDDGGSGLMPTDDLGWVDNLDDKAVERAERWLEHKKS